MTMMFQPRSLFAITALTALVSLTPAAYAAASPKDKADARALVTDGRKAAKDKRWADAVSALSRADELDPSPAVALELAEAQIAAGKLVDASKVLAALSEGQEPAPAAKKLRETAKKMLFDLKLRIPTIKIALVDLTGNAVVALDGVQVDVSHEIPVDPGEHALVASSEGFVPATKKVQVTEGTHETVELVTTAVVADPDEPSASGGGRSLGGSRTLLPAAIVTGVGGVTLVVGTILGGAALSATSDAKKACDKNGICPDTPGQHDKIDKSKRLGDACTGMLVAGGVVTAAGALLLVFRPFDGNKGDAPKSGRVVPWIGPRGEAGIEATF